MGQILPLPTSIRTTAHRILCLAFPVRTALENVFPCLHPVMGTTSTWRSVLRPREIPASKTGACLQLENLATSRLVAMAGTESGFRRGFRYLLFAHSSDRDGMPRGKNPRCEC